jgi:hypothetical protein
VVKINIGKEDRREPPPDLFPQEIERGIYRCGYNARSSFGAHSYFIQGKEGNVLIDSPRYVAKLVEAFERVHLPATEMIARLRPLVDRM